MPTKIRLEHVISFSDAIFAFSITFMAISIQLPDVPTNLSQSQVLQILSNELGLQFKIYAISYFVIGAYWISYHQIFNHVAGSHMVIV
jgi:TMEM175 potassium channel family protein